MKIKNLFLKLLLSAAAISAVSCANQVAPQGGPKDTTAPSIDSTRSMLSGAKNFTKQPITLTFKEWIQLQDVDNQTLISPPLIKKPKIDLRGKSLRLTFADEEILKPNVTYNINFGNSISDLTEKNVTKNAIFIFSTGNTIDSLTLRGSVVSAITGKPVADAWAMLYENWRDSSITRRERPFYATKTDKEGIFLLKNLRNDTFGFSVLVDADRNYLLDQPNEKIGFISSNSLIVSDTTQKVANPIRVFENEKPLRLLDKNTSQYGLIGIKFNRTPYDAKLQIKAAGISSYQEPIKGDSLRLWYAFGDTLAHNWQLIVNQIDSTKFDTINVKSIYPKNNKKDSFLLPIAGYSKGSKSALHSDKPIMLGFNRPLKQVDTERVKMYADSSLQKEIKIDKILIDSFLQNTLRLKTAWQEGANYTLVILPNALVGWNESTNKDTLRQNYSVTLNKNLSEISLAIDSLNTRYGYAVTLRNGEQNIAEFYIENTSSAVLNINSLDGSETYNLKILEDINHNRVWDTGNYDLRREPEYFFFKSLDAIQAGFTSVIPVTFIRQYNIGIESDANPKTDDSPNSRSLNKKGKN